MIVRPLFSLALAGLCALSAAGDAVAQSASQSTEGAADAAPAAEAAAPGGAARPEGDLSVELNKLETAENGACRAFFLFRNATGLSFEGFEMSLAVLDGQGVIDRLLSIDASPLPVARTTLKLFEIPEIGCGDISEILLHDITSCRPQNADDMDCFPIVALSSRAAPQLVK